MIFTQMSFVRMYILFTTYLFYFSTDETYTLKCVCYIKKASSSVLLCDCIFVSFDKFMKRVVRLCR